MRILLLVCLGLAVIWLLPASSDAAPCRLDLGSPAPTLKGTGIDGNWHQLDNYRGQWVFLDFWATWCKPCMRNLPNVVKLDQELGQRPDFTVLSVSLDNAGAQGNLQSTAEKFGVDFPVVYDGDGWQSGNARNWCVDAIPATYLIDPQGKVIARDVNPAEVGKIISAAAQDDYRVIQIISSEELLPASRSTGSSRLMDLVVSVNMQADSPDISQYYLEVLYKRDSQGDAIIRTLRYEINVIPLPDGTGFPYDIEINQIPQMPTPSARASFEEYEHVETWYEMNLPGVSVEVDLGTRSYRFEVPVPRSSTSIAYSISLYDERVGQYISNGVRRLELTSGSS